MNDDADSIESFLNEIETERKCSAREVVEFMRSRLGSVDERVEDGMAIFSKDGKDITGVSVSNRHINLFVPDKQVADEFSEKLGKAEAAEDCVRFEQLTDIKRSELKNLVDRLGQESNDRPGE